MKSPFSLIALSLAFAIAGGANAQSISQLQQAADIVHPHLEGGIPPAAAVAFGVVDNVGKVVLSGKAGGQLATITAGSTPSFAPINGQTTFAYTPAQAATFAATTTGAVSGQFYSLVITTSGTTSYTLTFGTNFTSIGTLETGTTSGVVYEVVFQYDGTTFREVDRVRQGSPVVTVPVVATTSTLPYAEGATLYNWTPTSSENLAIVPAGRSGAVIYLQIIGDGSAARTTTFTTNVKSTGTLATGASGATNSTATFVSDGTNWREVSRGTALAP